MKPTTIRVRFKNAGGHVAVTFWTGAPGYTFAHVGTLTMDVDDARLFESVLWGDQRIQVIKHLVRGDGQ